MTFAHCPGCGAEYAHEHWDRGYAYSASDWPKHCHACTRIQWKNPQPVVAVLQPVIDRRRFGLVIAKRAIEPKIGSWSLVGGFMETGETMEEAAAREFREETSLEVASYPQYAFSAHVGPTSEQLMLMTYIDKPMPFDVFLTGRPCPENQELGVLWNGDSLELAFPIHCEAAMRFFTGEFEWHL
jgi:NADH pyrophosphatase NudC (nudix superfamily)